MLTWQRMPDGINEGAVKAVVALASAKDIVIAATDRGVYRKEAAQPVFTQVLRFPAGQYAVYSLYSEGDWVAVATNHGIWESNDSGVQWKKTFDPAHDLHRQCYAVFKSSGGVFVGTAEGLFRRDVNQSGWYRHTGALGSEPVYAISGDDAHVFFAAGDGIYREPADGKDSIKKIFSVIADDDLAVDEFLDEDKGSVVYAGRFIRSLTYDAVSGTLFVAAQNGFWISSDEGESWNEFSNDGFKPGETEKIIFCQSCLTSHGQRAPDIQNRDQHFEPEPILFLASRKGVFLLNNRIWRNVYQGLSSTGVNEIFIDGTGRILAATDSGLFVLNIRQQVSVDYRTVSHAWAYDPSIQDVHKMVTFYADVGKDKTDNWKVLSRRKAVLPSVSWQVQRDISDIYHWDSGANPDVLQKGIEAMDWSVTLKWELSDLIWSTAQTTIDTRSKIMVELRESLLAQATRIYFERRRLQVESAQIPDDSPEKWQMELRIEELTAGLDAMTGGRFSKEMSNVKIQNSR